ncbi:hypothetical protein [uncultured Anaeromusa sp.]|nr:hypothetical protein [uncultured Anaeromusa sp.]
MCEIGVSTLEEALVRAEELFQKKGQCKIKTKVHANKETGEYYVRYNVY